MFESYRGTQAAALVSAVNAFAEIRRARRNERRALSRAALRSVEPPEAGTGPSCPDVPPDGTRGV
ncbi:MAG: hypothetical protein LBR87_01245 [Synergistaceae bacterium]|jgi:hypothetical protein|nr:hypothetical protein [Synergistaceae bacterium]